MDILPEALMVKKCGLKTYGHQVMKVIISITCTLGLNSIGIVVPRLKRFGKISFLTNASQAERWSLILSKNITSV